MKKSLVLFPLIACVSPVFAEDTEVEEKPDAKPMAPLMRALDRNGDGSLQQAEIDMAVVVLRRMDRNGDGTVSGDELVARPAVTDERRPGSRPEGDRRPDRPGQPGRDGQPGMPDLSRLDTDGDGKISKDEAPERMKERFDMIDGNGDGFVDKAEQEQLIRRLRERFQQGGQGRRPGTSPDGGDTTGGETPKRPEPIE